MALFVRCQVFVSLLILLQYPLIVSSFSTTRIQRRAIFRMMPTSSSKLPATATATSSMSRNPPHCILSNRRETMMMMHFPSSPIASHHKQNQPIRTKASSSTSLSGSAEGDFDPEIITSNSNSKSNSIRSRIRALYKFTRPHTIRGTILASIAGTIRALRDTPGAISNAQWSTMLPRAFLGMLALLLGNAFIVGINQIFDEDIDKLNKPFLPVASGEMSKPFAWLAVLGAAILGPILVYTLFPRLLFKLYMTGCFLGGIYSVPPIRTKRNAIAAGLTIALVRGFLLNFGVYYAVKDAIGAPFSWSPKVSFVARFMTVFAMVIAITKDLPDTEGDKAFQIETFATKIGVSKIAKGATAILFLNYMSAIATPFFLSQQYAFRKLFMIGGHLALACTLLYRFYQLDSNSMPSIKMYYKHIWDLFYLEYVLYTLI